MASLQCSMMLNGGVYAEKKASASASRIGKVNKTLHVCSGAFNDTTSSQTRSSDKVGLNLMKLFSKDATKANSSWIELLTFPTGNTFSGAASSEGEQQISAKNTKAQSSSPLPEHLQSSKSSEVTTSFSRLRRERQAFTPEKARILRQKLRLLESWHDTMYHSAIATRLAMQHK